MSELSTRPQPVRATSGLKPQVEVLAIRLPDGRLLDVNQMLVDSREQYRNTRTSHNLLTQREHNTSMPAVSKKTKRSKWSVEECQRIHQLYKVEAYDQICQEFDMRTTQQARQLANRARVRLRQEGEISRLKRGIQKRG